MIFLNIYIGFSILTFVMFFIQGYLISKQLERKYPELVNEFNKNNKSGILEKIFSWIKIFIGCFVPIINIGIFYVSVFGTEKIEKEFLNKILKK